jgi:hypothetical protein
VPLGSPAPNLIRRGGSQTTIGAVPSAPGANRNLTLRRGPGTTVASTNQLDRPSLVETRPQTRSAGAASRGDSTR